MFLFTVTYCIVNKSNICYTLYGTINNFEFEFEYNININPNALFFYGAVIRHYTLHTVNSPYNSDYGLNFI